MYFIYLSIVIVIVISQTEMTNDFILVFQALHNIKLSLG